MLDSQISALQEFIEKYRDDIPSLTDVADMVEAAVQQQNAEQLLASYHQVYPMLEQRMWHGGTFSEMLNCYHALFREQEALICGMGENQRYRFIISIPVADRPQHANNCLDSIYQLCMTYAFGGRTDGQFSRIQVVLADDSREEDSRRQHQALAGRYTEKGLRVHYFGQQEQYDLMMQIPEELQEDLGSILSTQPEDRFYLKGQAANRNLSYLKCQQLTEEKAKTLYYFVDSDQSFRVDRMTDQGEQSVLGLNYFYYINHIFSTTDVQMLTGKLVGDPPVSPAVMASNFLDDVLAFLQQMAQSDGSRECAFHRLESKGEQKAAYHDMAGLFGFENRPGQPFPYHCPEQGAHDNLDCLKRFSEQLNAFFYGQHLTRKTPFAYRGAFTDLSPARTVYPGNYVVNYTGLKYIIPFGHLRLRMSGPTAGRLIRAEIGDRFSSTNLPMLHTRYLSQGGADEFRPGVNERSQAIDLGDEFERQFFGDLMLFTVEELTRHSEFSAAFTSEAVMQALNDTEQKLLQLYQSKHDEILHKNQQLQRLLEDSHCWWQQNARAEIAIRHIRQFITNIHRNFSDSSPAYQLILNPEHRDRRKQQICEALLHYRQSRQAWDRLFD